MLLSDALERAYTTRGFNSVSHPLSFKKALKATGRGLRRAGKAVGHFFGDVINAQAEVRSQNYRHIPL
jgi:hypothetical protein